MSQKATKLLFKSTLINRKSRSQKTTRCARCAQDLPLKKRRGHLISFKVVTKSEQLKERNSAYQFFSID